MILSDLYQRFNETGRDRGVYSDARPAPEVCQNGGKEKSGQLKEPTAPSPLLKEKLEVQLQAKLELSRIVSCRRPAVVPTIASALTEGVH
ncbi:MAG TPA: hypothetical protein VE969_06360, partial [Pyrinomonadaceae bacterium]|nr:hypothetical protein [Pyrinomonadaceae bacterium]